MHKHGLKFSALVGHWKACVCAVDAAQRKSGAPIGIPALPQKLHSVGQLMQCHTAEYNLFQVGQSSQIMKNLTGSTANT